MAIFGDSNDNYLPGTADTDYIDGREGQDTMEGFTGDDTYVVDILFNINGNGDNVIEQAGEGTDTVVSSADFFHNRLFNNVENLTLVGNVRYGRGNDLNNTIQGTDGDNVLWGHEGNDYLYSNAGNDYLNGYGGGTERDRLTGGTEADQFVLGGELVRGGNKFAFYTGDGDAGYATIRDFSRSSGDKIIAYGSRDDYRLDYSQNLSGTSAKDTAIYYENDLIAVVTDKTYISRTQDFTFVL